MAIHSTSVLFFSSDPLMCDNVSDVFSSSSTHYHLIITSNINKTHELLKQKTVGILYLDCSQPADTIENLGVGAVQNTDIPIVLLVSDNTIHLSDKKRNIFEQLNRSADTIHCLPLITRLILTNWNFFTEKRLCCAMVNHACDAIMSLDEYGTIVFWNYGAETLFGYSSERMIGETVGMIMPDRYHAIVLSKIQRARISSECSALNRLIELRGIDKDCREFPIEFTVSSYEREGRRFFTVIMRDITKRKVLENQTQRMERLESIGRLAGGIAHDFNNILTAIMTNLFMAKLKVQRDDEIYSLLLEAEAASVRAGNLTKQFLTFAQGGVPVKRNISLKNVIEKTVGFFLNRSNITFDLQLPIDLWNTEIDRGQIEQVLHNLIYNADQAMEGNGTLCIKAENVHYEHEEMHNPELLVPLKPGEYVKVSFADDGCGIAKKDIHKIFDPYFTTKESGRGLGLTIVHSVVQKHGGFITVNSEAGNGATFSFYLPASKNKVLESRPSISENQIVSGHILVMDDDMAVQKAITLILHHVGYSVTSVTNGNDTIEKYTEFLAKGTRFDAVIMDLTIPGGKGGKETVQDLLLIDTGAKVIVTSGYSNDPVIADYSRYGFAGALKKPFTMEELKRTLFQIIKPVLSKGL